MVRKTANDDDRRVSKPNYCSQAGEKCPVFVNRSLPRKVAYAHTVAVWYGGSALVSVKVLNRCWTRIVQRWLTVRWFKSRSSHILIFNQSQTLTQPGRSSGVSKMSTNESCDVNRHIARPVSTVSQLEGYGNVDQRCLGGPYNYDPRNDFTFLRTHSCVQWIFNSPVVKVIMRGTEKALRVPTSQIARRRWISILSA